MCLSLSIYINTVYHVTGLYLSPRSKLTGNIYDLKKMNDQNQSQGQTQNVPTNSPWYKKWWGVLLIIMLFPVLVPYLVWTKTNWYKGVKIAITAACVLFVVSNYYDDKKEEVEKIEQQAEQVIQMESIVQQAEGYIKENKIEEALITLTEVSNLDTKVDKSSVNELRTKINQFQNPNFIKRTLADMSDDDFELLKKGEIKTSFIDHSELNRLFLIKLQENSDQRSVYIAEIKEQKKKEQEEAEKKKQEAEAKERTEMIEKQFSAWDGSHIKLSRLVKDSMNDPDSYDHAETKYWDMDDHIVVLTTFRGKNAFGGTVKNSVKAKISLDGESIEIIEQY
jgi:hypothetical protein